MWLFALLWTFIAIAPYAGMTSTESIALKIPVLTIGVAGDRFLYYSAAGASLLLVISAQWVFDEFQSFTRYRKLAIPLDAPMGLLFLLILGLNAFKIGQFEADWDKAGRIGNSIVQQVRELLPNPSVGAVLCIENLPDNYHGKYIFRNGISQALYLSYARDDFIIRELKGYSQLDETDCSNILYYDGYSVDVKDNSDIDGQGSDD